MTLVLMSQRGDIVTLSGSLKVSDNPLDSQNNRLYRSQLSLRHNETIMKSSDSGAFSIEHYS